MVGVFFIRKLLLVVKKFRPPVDDEPGLGEVKTRDEMRASRKIQRRSDQMQRNVQVSRERICDDRVAGRAFEEVSTP
jgi:hypothetical protein